jgi:Transposase zinc-ribbon domain
MARARSLTEFQTAFPDEASCAAFLFERRWPDGFVCTACGNARAAALKSRHTLMNVTVVAARLRSRQAQRCTAQGFR